MKRRHFIQQTAAATAALVFYKTAAAAAENVPLGFQSWPIKDMLGKDFPGTLKTMSGMGYKLIELCSPAGYKDLGFGFLANMSTADIRKTIEDAGLHCPSSHFGFAEFNDDRLDQSIQFATGMGFSQMVCSTFGLPKTAQLSDYQAAADKLNKAAEKIKAAGMATGYHNHDTEFTQLDGQLIYDALMARFDAKLVKMQFQTEVINLGYKAADYFRKYPGRFISSHLSDWTADKKQVPVGQGVIDWKEFFKAAKTGGVKNFFVEMKFETLADSAKYITAL
jgi:sugar phosphate isomerase/epimerase